MTAIKRQTFATGQTIANLTIAPLGADGRLGLYAQTAVELAVDVSGWFTAPAG